jgi:hypothetical protein
VEELILERKSSDRIEDLFAGLHLLLRGDQNTLYEQVFSVLWQEAALRSRLLNLDLQRVRIQAILPVLLSCTTRDI